MSYYVFSDVDETLIRFKSMIVFMKEFLFNSLPQDVECVLNKQIEFKTIIRLEQDYQNNRQDLNKRFYYLFNGISKTVLEREASHWVNSIIENNGLFIEKVLNEFYAHKARGAKIVLVSGSFKEILMPIMSYVKADHLICSELELKDDFYTGRLLKQVIGEGKWQAIRKYIHGKNVELSACYAYGDHKSDLYFLDKVGHPIVVGNAEEMVAIAQENGWAIINQN